MIADVGGDADDYKGKLGRNRPTLEQAQVTVGIGVTTVTIHAQYLRGIFSGFGPIDG